MIIYLFVLPRIAKGVIINKGYIKQILSNNVITKAKNRYCLKSWASFAYFVFMALYPLELFFVLWITNIFYLYSRVYYLFEVKSINELTLIFLRNMHYKFKEINYFIKVLNFPLLHIVNMLINYRIYYWKEKRCEWPFMQSLGHFYFKKRYIWNDWSFKWLDYWVPILKTTCLIKWFKNIKEMLAILMFCIHGYQTSLRSQEYVSRNYTEILVETFWTLKKPSIYIHIYSLYII